MIDWKLTLTRPPIRLDKLSLLGTWIVTVSISLLVVAFFFAKPTHLRFMFFIEYLAVYYYYDLSTSDLSINITC